MERRFFSVCVLLILTVALAVAKDFWKEKPYTEWSRKEAEKMLQDSPWTKLYTEGGALRAPSDIDTARPGGAGAGQPPTGPYGGGTEPGAGTTPRTGAGDLSQRREPQIQASGARYVISWYSATPVRQALVRLGELEGRLSEDQKKNLLNEQNDYVIAVSGSGARTLATLSADDLKKAAYLTTSSSKEKFQPVNAMPPNIEKGQPALFFFAREVSGKPLITEKDKDVTFNLVLKNKTIRTKFKTKDMIYNGKLDI